MEENKIIISPKTKVLQLIEAYPHLEDILISRVPAFKKLKNPVLRNTVAKIATLQQAAAIGNIKTEELINLLRLEAGQDMTSFDNDKTYTTQRPEWFDETLVYKETNINPMLDAGDQPVNLVMSELNEMPAGSIYKVIAPFIPAPLIDKSLSVGFLHWVNHESDDMVLVYFVKPRRS